MGSGPLKVRIEGAEAALRGRAEREGFVLAEAGEEADLVARPEGRTGGHAGQEGDPVLSPRETEIVEYLADGWSNEEIASALRIGQRTVRFHLESIYAKFGVSRRGEAVREAVARGIVSFEA